MVFGKHLLSSIIACLRLKIRERGRPQGRQIRSMFFDKFLSLLTPNFQDFSNAQVSPA